MHMANSSSDIKMEKMNWFTRLKIMQECGSGFPKNFYLTGSYVIAITYHYVKATP